MVQQSKDLGQASYPGLISRVKGIGCLAEPSLAVCRRMNRANHSWGQSAFCAKDEAETPYRGTVFYLHLF
jgi:hypothetical protein